MIIAQLVLLHACTQYSEVLSNDDEENPERSEKFWRWTAFTPYCTQSVIQGPILYFLLRGHSPFHLLCGPMKYKHTDR